MSIEEYKKLITKEVKPRTVCFLVKDGSVLLGMKKRGFGKGNFLGIGGKVESNETIEEAALRELREEIGTTALNLWHTAVLNFYFPHMPDESWNQQVHVFMVNRWTGEPVETDEILPQWFQIDKLPIDSMWDDAHYWLPEVLKGSKVVGDFLFNDQFMVIDKTINSL